MVKYRNLNYISNELTNLIYVVFLYKSFSNVVFNL